MLQNFVIEGGPDAWFPADRSNGHTEEAVILFGPADLTPAGPPSLRSCVQNPAGFVELLLIFREFDLSIEIDH